MSSNIRVYNIPDAELLQVGELMVVALPDDNAAFTAFDSTISATYPETIRAALDLTKSIHTDDVIIQEQAELTSAAHEAHQKCYTAYLTIAYFVRKAYASNRAMQRKFGLVEIRHVQFIQNKFIRFMEELSKLAEQYKEVLIRVGCSPDTIASLPVLTKTLLEADRAQEKFKKDRGLITQDRIGSMNELYTLLQPIDEVAQIIYRNDPARLAKYMLPRPDRPSPPAPESGKPPDPQP